MPIECNTCHAKTRTVFYRSYSYYPRQIRNLWWLVVVAACTSTYNAINFLVQIAPLYPVAQQVKEAIEGAEELGTAGAILGDLGTVFFNLLNYLVTLAVIAALYVPIRYGIVLKRFRRGKPTTFWQIRAVAWLTVGVALFTQLSIVVLFSSLRVIHFGPSVSFNVVIAAMILAQMQRREVKEYFSQFNWEALPPQQPVASTFLPEAAPAKSEWERIG